MKTGLLFLFFVQVGFYSFAQNSVLTSQKDFSFIIRYRPLIVWNGIGMGYYLHPNHSVEVYGTGQATVDLLDAQLILERAFFLEYRYYVADWKRTRWFLSSHFKHGRGDYVSWGEPDPSPGWIDEYFKDNTVGMAVGFQFMKREKKRGRAYAEIFVGPQYIFRGYRETYRGSPIGEENRLYRRQGWGFVRFGINFCYDFYRKNK